MKRLLPFAAGLAIISSPMVSCSSDNPSEPEDFNKLTPGLYVTEVDTLTFEPYKLDKGLFVDKTGGFFARGVNVFPEGTPVQADTWTVDSVTWIQIDSVIRVPEPSAPIKFETSPWEDDTTFKVTNWLWVERIKPEVNPALRPMVVKLSQSYILNPRDIKIHLSQKPYRCVYPVTQFGLSSTLIEIEGRSVDAATLPTVAMKAVRRPDGTFAVSRR